MPLSEKEKYERKQALLTRALASADKLDEKDKQEDASEKQKKRLESAKQSQERQAHKEKDGKKAEKDAEPVLG
jgi:hypothetical protein